MLWLSLVLSHPDNRQFQRRLTAQEECEPLLRYRNLRRVVSTGCGAPDGARVRDQLLLPRNLN
jgi:hypothetical protein